MVDVNFITFQTVDREICSVFSFYKGIWDQPLCHIFCIIFQENFFSFYILITEQISWSGCWVFFEMLDNIYLQLFAIQSMMKWILKLTLAVLLSCFSTWPKSQNKTFNISRMKRAFNIYKKHVPSNLTGFHWSK